MTTVLQPALTIALFGANSPTGRHFLRAAVDAGYKVRSLVDGRCSLAEEFADQTACKWVTGSINDASKVKRVLKGVDYVVSFLGDSVETACSAAGRRSKRGQTDKYPAKQLTNFVKLLYPLMKKERSIQVFLYQATSLAADVNGYTPKFSGVVKKVAVTSKRSQFLKDQDAAIQQIAEYHHGKNDSPKEAADKENEDEDEDYDSFEDKENSAPHFSYIITRPPGYRKEGTKKKLSASKSQPGIFRVSHAELAEFSLNALPTKKLYNTCPYVVADSF
jgi:hypothetical protein